MMSGAARVRWGNQRFWRINEFATEDAAREFAEEIREAHGERVNIVVERREGERWVPASVVDSKPHRSE